MHQACKPTRGGVSVVLALAGSLIGACVLGACTRGDAALQMARPGVPVTVVAAKAERVPVQVQAVGHVEAFKTVNVTSRVDGQITAVHFKEGDEVAAGAPLFQLDPRPFQAQLDAAKAKAAQDQAQLDNATRNDARNLELVEKKFLSPQAYDTAHTATRTFEAALAGDHAAIDSARLNLEYSTIRAPIAGRTGKILVQQGNQVHANDTAPLVTINQISPIYVSFAVPERYLAEIRKNQAEHPLEVTVRTPDGSTARGSLAFINNAVDPGTGTVLLRTIFENSSRGLWPEQFASATLVLAEQQDAVVVPEAAVQAGPTGRYLWVVKDDLTAEQRSVNVGRTQDGQAVIASGLAAGERVVLSGALRITAGARMQVLQSLAEAP
jgi:multidrug efflux system membrane fusion protein